MTPIQKARQLRDRHTPIRRTTLRGVKAIHLRHEMQAYGDQDDYLVAPKNQAEIDSLKQSARYSGFDLYPISQSALFHVRTWHSIGD